MLAFWEDSDDLWIIHDENDQDVLSIEEYWVRTIQARKADDAASDSGDEREDVNKDALGKAGEICAMACDLLTRVAGILKV